LKELERTKCELVVADRTVRELRDEVLDAMNANKTHVDTIKGQSARIRVLERYCLQLYRTDERLCSEHSADNAKCYAAVADLQKTLLEMDSG
jgi:hypothetical protein